MASGDKPKCLVTGVAGFIGSHVAERLVGEGYAVTGVDCFTDYYPEDVKRQNVKNLLQSADFRFIQQDIIDLDLPEELRDVAFVLHFAAQAGVRSSWGQSFESYVRNNILATQRLLEACKANTPQKFVFASSSSVYGDTDDLPMKETSVPRPISPYGVSKLAAEHLCYLYWKSFNVPVGSLRYFTVYGPRQRPDMAFHKFIKAMLKQESLVVYGNGRQTRDFTYISDVVEATLLAMKSNTVGEVYNIGGGAGTELNSVIGLLEEIIGQKASITFEEPQKGDVRHTIADIGKARQMLGYDPRTPLFEGLAEQVRWMRAWLSQG